MLVKEALHNQNIPANNRLNCNRGYKLPGYWIVTMKKLGEGGGAAQTVLALAPQSLHWATYTHMLRCHAYKIVIIFTLRFTSALRMTRGSN